MKNELKSGQYYGYTVFENGDIIGKKGKKIRSRLN